MFWLVWVGVLGSQDKLPERLPRVLGNAARCPRAGEAAPRVCQRTCPGGTGLGSAGTAGAAAPRAQQEGLGARGHPGVGAGRRLRHAGQNVPRLIKFCAARQRSADLCQVRFLPHSLQLKGKVLWKRQKIRKRNQLVL